MTSSPREMPQLTGATTLGEQLEDVLRQAILDGTLPAGSRVQPDDLAEHFGVSRIPIREALRALDASGWVDIRPRHGVYVRQRRREELEQLFEVRAPLEAQACHLAALRRSEEELAELDALAHRSVAVGGGGEQYAKINSEFHAAVVAAAHNEVLSGVLRDLRLRVQWYFAAVAPIRTRESIEEHLALVDAIRAQDGQAAAALGSTHVLDTLAVLRDQVEAPDTEDGATAS